MFFLLPSFGGDWWRSRMPVFIQFLVEVVCDMLHYFVVIRQRPFDKAHPRQWQKQACPQGHSQKPYAKACVLGCGSKTKAWPPTREWWGGRIGIWPTLGHRGAKRAVWPETSLDPYICLMLVVAQSVSH